MTENEKDADDPTRKELDKRAEEVINGEEGEDWVDLEDLME